MVANEAQMELVNIIKPYVVPKIIDLFGDNRIENKKTEKSAQKIEKTI